MSTRQTNVSTVRVAIRRLRALTAEIDRAVAAAARVRREIQKTLIVSQYPVPITKRG
jgi:hypothetical protein